MRIVRYFEKKRELLNQLRKTVPAVGDEIVVKGRKGKVLEVKDVDEKNTHVYVELEVIKKFIPSLQDKKRRR